MNTTKMRLVIFAFWVTAMVSPSLVPVCLARPLSEPQVQEGAGECRSETYWGHQDYCRQRHHSYARFWS
jgi:hypothetical protein